MNRSEREKEMIDPITPEDPYPLLDGPNLEQESDIEWGDSSFTNELTD